MGNRGLLHNDRQEIVRHSQLKRWIYCKLEFKGWHRKVMRPGHYTELFFLDEATALAAGHRPCMECQRERATEFKRIWNEVNEPVKSLVEMDEILRRRGDHGEFTIAAINALPDGAMVVCEDQPYLIRGGLTYRWSFGGYEHVELGNKNCRVLTPDSIVNILRAGFIVEFLKIRCLTYCSIPNPKEFFQV
jgi:hypothetical protein